MITEVEIILDELSERFSPSTLSAIATLALRNLAEHVARHGSATGKEIADFIRMAAQGFEE